MPVAPVVILPRTAAGRDLLRLVLPFAYHPDREPGELPDGSSIYGVDYDALAVEIDRESEAYDAGRRERDR